MLFVDTFVKSHKDLFVPMKSEHIHLHDHFLERTFLRFIPKWVTPNQITMFRVLATPVVFFLVFYGTYKYGVIAFFIVASTDAIDGSLARTKGKITQFGMMFDPLADKFLIGSMVLLLVFEYFGFWMGLTTLGLEILLILTALVAKYRFKTVKMANIWGKIKMLLQCSAVFFTLLALLLEYPLFLSIAAWGFGLAIGFAILSLFAHGI